MKQGEAQTDGPGSLYTDLLIRPLEADTHSPFPTQMIPFSPSRLIRFLFLPEGKLALAVFSCPLDDIFSFLPSIIH